MLRTILRPAALALLATPLAFASIDAQARSNGRAVPPGQAPRAGECRVWYEGRPPGQQPRATSCREAERVARGNRNARVIYGSDRNDGRWERDGRRDDRRDDDRWERDRRNDRRDDGRWERDGRNSRVIFGRGGVWDGRSPRALLPRMPRASELRGNRIPSDIRRRIGGNVSHARYVDRNRDNRPERVVFYDRRGRALETWYDMRGDGRADRIVIHRG